MKHSMIERLYCIMLSLLIAFSPVYANANAAAWTVSHTLPTFSDGFLKTVYSFKNSLTGVVRTAAGSMTMAQLGRIARFVISRRFAAFATLASLSSDMNFSVDGKGSLTYTPQANSNGDIWAIPFPTSPTTSAYLAVPTWGSTYCQFAIAYYQASFSNRSFTPMGSDWCTVIPAESGVPPSIMVHLQDTITNSDDYYGPIAPTLVPATDVRPATIPQTIQDEAYGAEIVAHATPSVLNPTFDYDQTYQSPAASPAVEDANKDTTKEPVALPFPDATTGAVSSSTSTWADTQSQTNSDTSSNTANPTASSLPDFCSWASSVCGFIEWVKSPPDTEPDNPLPIKDRDISLQSVPVSFSRTCPTAKTFSLNLGVTTKTIELPFDQFCGFLEKINPFVISIAYLHAAFIIFGRGTSNG